MLQFLRRKPRKSRAHTEAIEQEHDQELQRAERTLADLTGRADVAVRALNDRHQRNHWRESIEKMIQGAI